MRRPTPTSVAYFPITVTIPADGALSAGVNVSYYINVGDAEEGVLAPLSALKDTTEGTCLFVKSDARPDGAVDLEDGVVPDGFYAVPVEVGSTNSQYARILSGVEEGAEVFTRYRQTAPANGDTTSTGDTESTQQSGQGGFGGWAEPARRRDARRRVQRRPHGLKEEHHESHPAQRRL